MERIDFLGAVDRKINRERRKERKKIVEDKAHERSAMHDNA